MVWTGMPKTRRAPKSTRNAEEREIVLEILKSARLFWRYRRARDYSGDTEEHEIVLEILKSTRLFWRYLS